MFNKPKSGTNVKKYIAFILFIFSISFISYLVYLDAQVTELFSGKVWKIPARVYARPLELFVGKNIKLTELLLELELLGYSEIDQIPFDKGQYHTWPNHLEITTRAFQFSDEIMQSRSLHIIIENDRVVSLKGLLDNKDVPILRLEPVYIAGIFPTHKQDRDLIKFRDTPQIFKKMLVHIEDRRFYEHHGLDFRSIARAFVANMKAGRTVQGGSTLTQQLVKNLFLSSERSLSRKINEAFMAILLELHYDKELILETYINEVFLGQDGNRAIHGFGLASKHYFGKQLTQLQVDEMALLVGLIKGPSYFNPGRNPDRAKKRRDLVLHEAAENKIISHQQYLKLVKNELNIVNKRQHKKYPAFLDMVKRQLRNDYNKSEISEEGLIIFTTLDPVIQLITENAVKNTLPRLSQDKDLQAAVIVASSYNGEIKALVGDRRPSYPGFNRAIDAIRPMGSLIKPVIYLSALKMENRYTLATVLDDSRLRLKGEDGQIWEPQNFDREYRGDVLLFDALLKSYNIPTVRLGLEVGLDNISKTINELGINQTIPSYPSITLGAFEMSPLNVTSMYQTFATNGYHSDLRSVRSVLNKSGKPLSRYSLDVQTRVDDRAISLVNFTLQNITESGTAKEIGRQFDVSLAGKTGTSDNYRDSWYAGFNADTVAVVWLGKDNNEPTYLTGSSGAMKVWIDIFKQLHNKPFVLNFPDSIDMAWIDRANGKLSNSECSNAIELPFVRGSQPAGDSCEANNKGWFEGVFSQ